MEEEHIREKFMEFQMVQQQLEKISAQAEQLQEQLQELAISRQAIVELGKTKEKTTVLAPIANGIFVKTTLIATDTVVVNVGADVTVERKIPEVVALLEQQQEELQEKFNEVQEVIEAFHERAMKLYQEVEDHVQEVTE